MFASSNAQSDDTSCHIKGTIMREKYLLFGALAGGLSSIQLN
jgi:hypothetical protein